MGDLLSHLRFRWLLASNLSFFLAMQSQSVVRALIAWELTGSEYDLATVMFAVALPMFAISPFGGVLADRVDRRRLIAFGQGLVVASEAVIFGLLVAGRLEFWHLVCGALVMGSVFPLIMPARQAIVANLVGRDRLSGAIALNMTGMNATRVIGPALGGVLASQGIVLAYGAGIAGYLVALSCLAGVGSSQPDAHMRDVSVLHNLREGVRYMADNRLVVLLLVFGLVPMFLAMPFQNMLVVFAKEIWEVGDWGFGILSASVGLGGVIGSLIIAWVGDTRHRGLAQMTSMLGFGGLLMAFCVTPWFAVALPIVLLANVFASVFGTLNNTAIQLLIPDSVRGRVSSFLMMSFSLPMLGVLPIGIVAERFGVQVAVGGAAGLAVLLALAFWIGSSMLRNMDARIEEAMALPEPTPEGVS